VGIVFQVAGDKGLYIKEMSEEGAAAECGILKVGDCLMTIDGEKVYGNSAQDISRRIKGPLGSPVAVKFRRNIVHKDGRCEYMMVAPVLTRGATAELPQPAGIGVVFKVGHDAGMYVKAMSPDGAAAMSEQIMLNDLLIAVNGKDVYRKPVTQVTPMLVGSFGSTVGLTFVRLADGKETQYKVKLVRGKRATFHDTGTDHDAHKSEEHMITVAVPAGLGPRDVLHCEDEHGNTKKVLVPEGAKEGTLLRVPVDPASSSSGQSDPRILRQMLNDLEEVPGRPNVFLWRRMNKHLKQLRHNVDGTVTVEDADTGEVIWDGHPDAPDPPGPDPTFPSDALAIVLPQEGAGNPTGKGAVDSGTPLSFVGGDKEELDAWRQGKPASSTNVLASSLEREQQDSPLIGGLQDEEGVENPLGTQLCPAAHAVKDGLVRGTDFNKLALSSQAEATENKVALRAKLSVLDDTKIDTSAQHTSVSEVVEEFEKLIAM